MEVNKNYYYISSDYNKLEIFDNNCDYKSQEDELSKIADHCLQIIKEKSDLTKQLIDDITVMKNSDVKLSDKIVSCLKVADCFRYGWGVSENKDIVFRCSKWSANLHGIGKYYLAECYSYGMGVTIDDAIAFEYYNLSARSCYPLAQYQLGRHYQYGIGVIKDLHLAYINYELAAKQNDLGALTKLAEFYEKGIYVSQSTKKANEYKIASDVLKRSSFGKHTWILEGKDH